MSRRIVVVSAGLGVPSTTQLLADRLSGALVSRIGARGEAAVVEVVELRDLAVPLATSLVTGGVPAAPVEAARAAVARADGLIAATPVFGASYAGLFKLFVDALDPEALVGTPVLIAATAGTPRHSLVLDHALRPLFAHLRAVVVPTGVFAATDDFGGGPQAAPDDEPLAARIERAAGELAELIVGGRPAVAGFLPPGGPPAAHADETGFAALLRRHGGDPAGASGDPAPGPGDLVPPAR